jgi:hypothetical protein
MYASRSDMAFPDHEQGLGKVLSIPSQLRWAMLMAFVSYWSIGKTEKVVLCRVDIGY